MTHFRQALLRYAYAVDLEVRARAEWERERRPLIQVHGAAGVHPLVKIMLETAKAASYHGAQLGLDPVSSKRFYPNRRPGRPVGANSAPDRVTLAPMMINDRPGVLTLAVNRARGVAGDGHGSGVGPQPSKLRARPRGARE